jgi:hypothetical protein
VHEPTDPSRCLDDGCLNPVPSDAPVALCKSHLAIAGDWADRAHGVTDVLPSPCRLCGSRVGVHYPSGWVCEVCEWRHGDLVDAELPPPRVDVAYYVRYGDRVKIGTSSTPHRRLSAIWHDELLAFERGDRRLERRRHEQFAAERFDRTEWFALSERLRAHIEAVSAGQDDPWTRYLRWVSEAVALSG